MNTRNRLTGKRTTRILTILCLASLMLTAPSVQAEKVVVIPLGSKTYIGASIFWTGAWQDNFQYAIGDGMQYGGRSYICVKDHVSLDANLPPNEIYWSLMAEKGDTGPEGPKGIKGLQGSAGIDGAQGPAGFQGLAGADGVDGVDGVGGAQGDSGTSSWADGTGIVTATVNVGIGTGAATPGAKLHVDGGLMLGDDGSDCGVTKQGTIRWTGLDFKGCNGIEWLTFVTRPKDTHKIVFVTSGRYSGDLGGLSGADEKCMAHARAAQLPGTFKAWLSDDTDTAARRLVHTDLPYMTVGGGLVATSWIDLTDGYLVTSINTDEFGSVVGSSVTGDTLVWTGTNITGESTLTTGQVCENWTVSSGSSYGHGGKFDVTFYRSWTQSFGATCTHLCRLYCVQQ